MELLDYDHQLIRDQIVSSYPPGDRRAAWLQWLDAVVSWNRGSFVGPMPEPPIRGRSVTHQ